MTETLLTPAEICRARDLIQLGPLTAEPELDLPLAKAGLAHVYCTAPKSTEEKEEKPDEDAAEHMAGLIKRKRPFITAPTRHARQRFYNRQGGVKGKWWKGSGRRFADYMQP